MPSQLGYWAIRGLAQPIRLLLNYVGEEFKDNRYMQGDAPEYSRAEWEKVKYTLGLDFPNLPYYIDDKVKLTQSNAILRYLARKHNLYGSTVVEQAHVDLLLDVIMDVRNGFVRLCYGPDFSEQVRSQYIAQARPALESLEKYLGDKQFFIGDKITVCDFHIFEMLDVHKLLEPSLLEERPKLKAYLNRFASVPAIAKYLASDENIVRPINNKSAKFL
ncbi:glutathione S-transferase Mu 4-like [Biomphalaria glabrata]|uniref:glutathione transferase n=1 Tax=Biomphalaria glabrata TaxID=6526 RepID=A0A2C9L7N6_BIOGL|nr:glutathione S-transferase Mu 4-like [Biomphalaria glabrata]XP_013097112.1 glutathione S-transferase Mu 4-like [Biomphalaria glabrata]XP_013097113.1 glutathione S-transferase Mu 4-like [Biomphalaria glabrata]XP_013097114.1 glutathione S-transferase Mu 4-like [Biomphalaria glabrata]XP_055883304.1 glutathione S-transferase Mu 4-like [Biomphalaria glabrata]